MHVFHAQCLLRCLSVHVQQEFCRADAQQGAASARRRARPRTRAHPDVRVRGIEEVAGDVRVAPQAVGERALEAVDVVAGRHHGHGQL